jgi:hypothetical protein
MGQLYPLESPLHRRLVLQLEFLTAYPRDKQQHQQKIMRLEFPQAFQPVRQPQARRTIRLGRLLVYPLAKLPRLPKMLPLESLLALQPETVQAQAKTILSAIPQEFRLASQQRQQSTIQAQLATAMSQFLARPRRARKTILSAHRSAYLLANPSQPRSMVLKAMILPSLPAKARPQRKMLQLVQSQGWLAEIRHQAVKMTALARRPAYLPASAFRPRSTTRLRTMEKALQPSRMASASQPQNMIPKGWLLPLAEAQERGQDDRDGEPMLCLHSRGNSFTQRLDGARRPILKASACGHLTGKYSALVRLRRARPFSRYCSVR